MWFHIFRSIGRATRGPVALLVLVTSCTMAQSPGVSSPRPQEQLQERERLIKQVDELRRAGKLDEAVAAAERALELERRAGGEASSPEAEALSRLAELHELRETGQGGGTAEGGAGRSRAVDGKDHWRTADARLALAFAEKVAGLGQADRAKVGGALRKENRRRPNWRSRASSLRRSAWRWKPWRPTGQWSVRSRRRWRGPGIESAGAGRHGTTQAEPRRPTSGL